LLSCLGSETGHCAIKTPGTMSRTASRTHRHVSGEGPVSSSGTNCRMALSLPPLHGSVGRCRKGQVYRAESCEERRRGPSAPPSPWDRRDRERVMGRHLPSHESLIFGACVTATHWPVALTFSSTTTRWQKKNYTDCGEVQDGMCALGPRRKWLLVDKACHDVCS
jgi:hypothetical protein